MNLAATNSQPVRPRDFATLLLASGDLLPRQRARDQQADIAGGELKRQVLRRIAELDPDPIDLPAALEGIVHELGEPSGPTRAIAASLREEFEVLAATPQLLEWLLDRGVDQCVP